MAHRILIVEDEEDNVILLEDVLRYALGDQQFFIARDGEEAVQLAMSCSPDIILMDLALPKLSGWEVTRTLRSDRAFEHVPIVAVTAHAMVGDRERALEAGCDAYFTKPVNVDAVGSYVKSRLAPSSESASSG